MDITEECNIVLDELSKFSPDLFYLGLPINDARLELFEKQLHLELPSDFKYLLKKHNGFSLDGTEVYGLDEAFRGSSLDTVYHFEHFDVGNPMPGAFFPFSPDGFGNHYCLDLSQLKEERCPVVFWQHDADYESYDVETCNESFISWVKEVMIDWTLEDYNYDGTEK